MTEAVKDLLAKSAQSIDAASLLLNDNYVDFSASRAYYAMFYAVEALLLSRDLSFSKHSAVISAFGKDYIKTGVFEASSLSGLPGYFVGRNKRSGSGIASMVTVAA